ncbi:mitochondrial inner membrane magnesium transporter mrs2 [Diaporthe helianthi]|uniref:Magnesium transporter n=1 Tax=Diaporthe helianthi TaxID=158607 RepID=A0A2P5I5B4_DIAHE|nr:mitochondrial inner membrane magnesium transporter mrs2 [Diaporthe helianthi]
MRSPMQPAVPSRRLLRFLRFQSEGIPFFSPTHSCTTGTKCHGQSPEDPRGSARAAEHPSCAARRLSTPRTSRSDAALRSAVFDLESIIPKSLREVRSSGVDLVEGNAATRSRRCLSTDEPTVKERSKTWQQRIWADPTIKPDFRSRATDDFGTSIFTSSTIARRAKAALEPVLRCTEVDEKGDVILTDGAFKKSELIAKYGLMPRDLRKIDSSNLPHILVRPAAILLNLLHLRVLIKHDRVLLFDVYGSQVSSAQSEFMYELQGKLRQKQAPGTAGGLPYEFRALEVVLMSVTSEIEKEFGTVQKPLMHLLGDLEEDVDREKLRYLLVLSKKVSTFEQKVRLVRDAIDELLEADDDLSQMYLTEKTRDISREMDDHTEVEMLLESYHKICDEVVQEASNLVSGIRNTEEVIRAILDANRNALMLLELKFSVGTLALAMGTFFAGLYGMNLENFIEETDWGFAGVTGASIFFSALVGWYGLIKLRKVQRVRMSNRRSLVNNPAGHEPYGAMQWYKDDSPTALLEAKHREKLKRIAAMKEQRPQATGFKKWLQKLR